jgi:hypothetical protein
MNYITLKNLKNHNKNDNFEALFWWLYKQTEQKIFAWEVVIDPNNITLENHRECTEDYLKNLEANQIFLLKSNFCLKEGLHIGHANICIEASQRMKLALIGQNLDMFADCGVIKDGEIHVHHFTY